MIRFTEPCPQCEGTGEVCSQFCDSQDPTIDAHPHHAPCPSCVGGTVPDDVTVEAAAKAAHSVGDEWNAHAAMQNLRRKQISRALIAAARHQQEGQ